MWILRVPKCYEESPFRVAGFSLRYAKFKPVVFLLDAVAKKRQQTKQYKKDARLHLLSTNRFRVTERSRKMNRDSFSDSFDLFVYWIQTRHSLFPTALKLMELQCHSLETTWALHTSWTHRKVEGSSASGTSSVIKLRSSRGFGLEGVTVVRWCSFCTFNDDSRPTLVMLCSDFSLLVA